MASAEQQVMQNQMAQRDAQIGIKYKRIITPSTRRT